MADTALDWADYRFTDRDVRDHPVLADVARNYLIQYTGDFEFLLEMRRKCERLTVPQARGVLNCMRNDPRAMTALMEILRRLPRAPELPAANGDGDFEAKVVDIKVKAHPVCEITHPHESHYLGRKGMCRGIPYEINRGPYFHFPASVKRPFAVSKTGNLIHVVAKDRHAVQWHPPLHSYGFGWCELYVNLLCRYPSSLRNPQLIDKERADILHDMLKMEWCRHCVKEYLAWHDSQSQSESESISLSQPDEETSGASVESTSRTVPQLVFMQPSVAPSEL